MCNRTSRWFGAFLLAGCAALPSAEAVAQTDKVVITPVLRVRYDSNPLRTNSQRFRGPLDDIRVSPGVAVVYNRTTGFGSLFARGVFSYDKYDRFDFLDRENITGRAGANIRLFGRCSISPVVSFARSQRDTEDLDLISNALTTSDYMVTATCGAEVGFQPAVTLSHSEQDNSAASRRRGDRSIDGVVGTLGFASPSIGRLDLLAKYSEGELGDGVLTGLGATRVERREFGIQFSREVSSIIQGKVGVSRAAVRTDGSIRKFSGTAWNGEIRISPVPRLQFTGTYSRAPRIDEGLGVEYTLARTLALGASLQVGARTRIGLTADQGRTRYFGEDPLIFRTPRIASRTRAVGANVRYDLTQRLSVTVDASYRERDVVNDFYDFDSTSVGIVLGGKF